MKDLEITIHSLQIMPDHLHRFVEADPTRCLGGNGQSPEGLDLTRLADRVPLFAPSLPTRLRRSYYAATVGAAGASVVHQ
jgi:putative transposase